MQNDLGFKEIVTEKMETAETLQNEVSSKSEGTTATTKAVQRRGTNSH